MRGPALLLLALALAAAERALPGERVAAYLRLRGDGPVGPTTAPSPPLIATYIDWRDINWLAPQDTVLAAVRAGFNCVILSFLLTTGPTDLLEGWAGLDAATRNATLAAAHAAGAVLMLSAGGASEEPYDRVSGADYGAAAGRAAVALGLDGVDFDLENIAPGFNFLPLAGQLLVDWLVNATAAARAAMGPERLLSHAPQAPYFGPIGGASWVGPSGGYTAVWRAAAGDLDWLNVQFYNQGSCYTSSVSLFTSSGAGGLCVFPGTSVGELAAMGVDKRAVVVGKPLLEVDADTGYVEAATLGQWVRAAAAAPLAWSAGAFGWSWEKSAGPAWVADVFGGNASGSPRAAA